MRVMTIELGKCVLMGCLVALAAILGVIQAGAQETAVGRAYRIAEPRAAGLELSFPARAAEGLRLTVGGRDFHVTHEFPPGAPATVTLVGKNGPLADGRYKYELRTQPVVDQRIRRIATENDDDELIRALAREEEELSLVQAGQFRIEGGSVVLSRPEFDAEPRAHTHGGETHSH